MLTRSTIILCVIAIVGVLAAVYVERRGALAGPMGSDGRVRPLFMPDELPADRVNRITLRRPEAGTIVFVREDGQWRQVQPFAHPMELHAMRLLVNQAQDLIVSDIIEPGGGGPSAAALGLAPPAADLTFAWDGGLRTLRFGRTGLAGRAYLRRDEDEQVYVVNHDLHQRAVDMDVREWRDRTIFDRLSAECDRVELVSSGSRVVLVRDRRRWRMDEPVRTRINEPALDELLRALAGAKCGGFVLDQPDDLSRFGLRPPAGSIAVTRTRPVDRGGKVVRDPETQTLLVGSRIGVGTQDRFGIRDGGSVVVRITKPVLKAFFHPPKDLVAMTASGAVSADVKAVRIDGPAGVVRLERKLDRWIAPEAGGAEVDASLVDDLLGLLTTARAAAVEIAPFPRDRSVATITMFGYDSKPLDTVRVAREPGEDDAGGRWALENGDGVLRVFPPNLQLRLTAPEYGLEQVSRR